MTIDLLKQNLITAAEIKDAAERVKAYRGVLTDAIDYIYESTNTHKPEKASLLELVDSDVLANYVQDSDVINSLHYVRILGMNAEHDQKIKKTADKLAYDIGDRTKAQRPASPNTVGQGLMAKLHDPIHPL